MHRTIDPTRPINDNCGWEHVLSDLLTFHDYTEADALTVTCATMEGILGPKSNRPVILGSISNKSDGGKGQVDMGAPVICTEFGGINIRPNQDEQKEGDWGYTTASDAADLSARIKAMVMGIVDGGLCCGLVYTQLLVHFIRFHASCD